MKTIKALLLVAAFSFSTIIAKANVEPTKNVDLETQLTELITKVNWGKVSEDTKIMVKLTVTSDNQLVVLSTDNADYDASVKSALNYKEIKTSNSLSNRVFYLPIKLEVK